MAMRFVFDVFALLLLFLCIVIAVNGGALPPKVFNVVKYGAVADGKTDNTQVSSSLSSSLSSKRNTDYSRIEVDLFYKKKILINFYKIDSFGFCQ